MKARDFGSGVLAGVNHSGDSDSTGSITGDLLGAALGASALPIEWVEGLEARTIIEELSEHLGLVQTFDSAPFGRYGDPENQVPDWFLQRYPGT